MLSSHATAIAAPLPASPHLCRPQGHNKREYVDGPSGLKYDQLSAAVNKRFELHLTQVISPKGPCLLRLDPAPFGSRSDGITSKGITSKGTPADGIPTDGIPVQCLLTGDSILAVSPPDQFCSPPMLAWCTPLCPRLLPIPAPKPARSRLHPSTQPLPAAPLLEDQLRWTVRKRSARCSQRPPPHPHRLQNVGTACARWTALLAA